MKKSEMNLNLIQNFILHITHSSQNDNTSNEVLPWTANELYEMANDYIEEDWVDGKEADSEDIKQAKQVLLENGYYVESLWHIDDVKGRHECSDDEAYEILAEAMEYESNYEHIWMSIESEIEDAIENKVNQ